MSISISTSACVSKWKLGRHKHKHKLKKNGQDRSSCACAYVVALTSENGVEISTSISTRPLNNHKSLWPEPMRTYQKQYGGRSVRHLVYNRVQESWYRELSQICHYFTLYDRALFLYAWKSCPDSRGSFCVDSYSWLPITRTSLTRTKIDFPWIFFIHLL